MSDTTADPYTLAIEAAARLRELTGLERHDVALVMGSGWVPAADLLGETVSEIPVTDLPGFHAAAVQGHSGTLRSVRLTGAGREDRHALVFLGRTHLYEGHGPGPVAHPVRVAAAAGVRLAVLTNASGTLQRHWAPGTGAVLTDHINWTGVSPLTGASFVDLTDAWSPDLRAAARAADPTLVPAVYAQMTGPTIQTGAESRMLRTVGADLVGMSTVVEAIAARAEGLELLGLSAVTTVEDSGVELDAEDVVAVATRTAERLGPVVRTVLRHWLARTPERTPS